METKRAARLRRPACQQRRYCLAPEPLLLPLPGVIGAGAGLVVLGLVVLGLVVLGLVMLPLPVAPAPAPARRSRRHFSRSSPRRALHLFSASIFAVPEALVPALPLALVPLEPEAVPPADAPPLTLEPDGAAVLPEVEPEDCAKLAEAKARSAAAVAAVIAFNIMWMIS
jgi:hypothetical protein